MTRRSSRFEPAVPAEFALRPPVMAHPACNWRHPIASTLGPNPTHRAFPPASGISEPHVDCPWDHVVEPGAHLHDLPRVVTPERAALDRSWRRLEIALRFVWVALVVIVGVGLFRLIDGFVHYVSRGLP